jgi:hypothetical protein
MARSRQDSKVQPESGTTIEKDEESFDAMLILRTPVKKG